MFWYILGYAYEVIVFATEDEARKAHRLMNDYDYYEVFEGRFGEEFSGWIGDHDD